VKQLALCRAALDVVHGHGIDAHETEILGFVIGDHFGSGQLLGHGAWTDQARAGLFDAFDGLHVQMIRVNVRDQHHVGLGLVVRLRSRGIDPHDPPRDFEVKRRVMNGPNHDTATLGIQRIDRRCVCSR
jgi:hypothetical protein